MSETTGVGGRVRARNQKRILKAAEEEFDRHGFGGARMQRIADRAGLPKANIHYYYKNKLALYRAVLGDVVSLWNTAFDRIHADDDPAQALAAYIRAKMEYSRTHPAAARIFTGEIMRGAPYLGEYLRGDLREWISDRAEVIQRWIDTGRMDAVDPRHLIFLIWSATQHYADYGTQISAVYGKSNLSRHDYNAAADSLVTIILKGCGLPPE
ncbi:MAG: TetR/AcrR family transcriptional regulator [Proteobacteria bacterium]|nr:MAG: TetR/AcrR family transcriptional regulator [Pseudomonadota bacterium]